MTWPSLRLIWALVSLIDLLLTSLWAFDSSVRIKLTANHDQYSGKKSRSRYKAGDRLKSIKGLWARIPFEDLVIDDLEVSELRVAGDVSVGNVRGLGTLFSSASLGGLEGTVFVLFR